VTTLALAPSSGQLRRSAPRRYLMCPPTYFDVTYAINPWMDPSVPVDRELAIGQWEHLVESYTAYGHEVELLPPEPGLPDMVFAANGATVIDGRVLEARFANDQRSAETAAHTQWHLRDAATRVVQPARAVNEGEGDFAVLSERVLAGFGFRTTRLAHRELAALTGREVISLELVDPRFYHLDVALTVLDDVRDHIAYYPAAFSRRSQRTLRRLFPDAIVATTADAYAFGLNGVSDGQHVFVPAGADRLMALLADARYEPIPIDLSELIKGGGSVKCCTQEIRPHTPALMKGS
jgi:N-dimethylarginine dimethylaminohydrolase